MKPVAVSQRVDAWPERAETRDALDQRLVELLALAGMVAFPVPNFLDEDQLGFWLECLSPEGVVLSGGNDVGAVPERDSTERALMLYASSRQLPLLGICRGMQFMATESGAGLEKIEGHVATRHELIFQGGVGERQEVNSFHNSAVSECPRHYEVFARCAEDGSIEAIRHTQLPWEAWMWHPEREASFASEDLERLQLLFGTAAGRS